MAICDRAKRIVNIVCRKRIGGDWLCSEERCARRQQSNIRQTRGWWRSWISLCCSALDADVDAWSSGVLRSGLWSAPLHDRCRCRCRCRRRRRCRDLVTGLVHDLYTRTSWYYRKNDDSLRFHVTLHAYMCGHMQDRACIPPCLHHSITPHADSDRLCVPSQDGSVARFALTKLFKVSHMRSKWVQKVLLINRSPALPLTP